jgi:hypothetical protein
VFSTADKPSGLKHAEDRQNLKKKFSINLESGNLVGLFCSSYFLLGVAIVISCHPPAHSAGN